MKVTIYLLLTLFCSMIKQIKIYEETKSNLDTIEMEE